MPKIGTSYRLVACDIETGLTVFDWDNVADPDRPHAHRWIEHNDRNWKVVGVSDVSTSELWRIDVKRLD